MLTMMRWRLSWRHCWLLTSRKKRQRQTSRKRAMLWCLASRRLQTRICWPMHSTKLPSRQTTHLASPTLQKPKSELPCLN
ncbi:hypothetical protein IW144_005699, partial [Coemansia sp. RSA 522]